MNTSPNPQVTDSSVISEPPDLRNWFSSYTYQSPELDTGENFCHSLRVQDGERGLCVEESVVEEEVGCEDLNKIRKTKHSSVLNEVAQSIIRESAEGAEHHADVDVHVPTVEVPAYLDSLSLPSEPPDIRNWFSSYVYESPALDSAEVDIMLSSNFAVGPIDEVDNEPEENSKELTGQMKLCPRKETNSEVATYSRLNEVESGQSHSTGQGNNCSKSTTYSMACFVPEKTSDESTEEAASDSLKSSVAYPIIEVEDVSPTLHEAQQTDGEKGSGSPSKSTSTEDDTETVAAEDKQTLVSKNDLGWVLPKYKSREAQSNSNTTKEQVRCQYSENGYMLKKRASPRVNNENSTKQVNPSDCNSNRNSNLVSSSSYQVKDGGLRREAFKEVTNFNHSLTEVAGKWRCPQKAKPWAGPPLKQLRLERWVRRV